MPIQIILSDEELQVSFNKHFNALMNEKSNYINPIKEALNSVFGYNGSYKPIIKKQVEEYLETAMVNPEFQQLLGKAMAEELARRAVDAMEKKNK